MNLANSICRHRSVLLGSFDYLTCLNAPLYSSSYSYLFLGVLFLSWSLFFNSRFVVLKSEKKGVLREVFGKLKRFLKKDAEEESFSSQEKSEPSQKVECVTREKVEWFTSSIVTGSSFFRHPSIQDIIFCHQFHYSYYSHKTYFCCNNRIFIKTHKCIWIPSHL